MAKKNGFHWKWKNSILFSEIPRSLHPEKGLMKSMCKYFGFHQFWEFPSTYFFYHLSGSRDQRCAAYTRPSSRFNLIWFRLNKSRDFCMLLFWGRKWRFSSAIWRVNIFNHLWFFCMIEYHHHSAVRRSPSYENFIVHHQGRFTQFQQIFPFHSWDIRDDCTVWPSKSFKRLVVHDQPETWISWKQI